MKFLKSFLWASLTMVMASMTACNSDDETYYDTYTNFSTLSAMGNGLCSFTVQQSNQTSPVDLTASVNLTSGFKVGGRYVIQYSNENAGPYAAGPITLLRAFEPFGGEASILTRDSISTLIADNINVVYKNRIGKWLDVQAYVFLNYAPQSFGLYVDEATINDEYPDAYIGYRSDSNSMANQYAIYGSFNLTTLMELPNVKGFTLHYQYNNTRQKEKFEL